MLNETELMARAQQIRLLVLDVDGVLTDGRLYYGASGEQLKVFNTLDGHGLKMLQKSGVQVALITGRRGEAILQRARDLGITLIQQGREDKFQALQELLLGTDYQLQQIACMGDDWPDLTVMRRVGLALTVPNAHKTLLEYADWCSHSKGGEGGVREACDLIMRAQNTFADHLGHYL
jgi:3-deoxy-D-manno-octulosonate 8-phosphate phosphatase (KDO 8-P phosphatase)